MTLMEDPTKWFGKVVGGIEDTWNMLHIYVAGVLPILNGKVLYIDVSRPFCRNTGVNHLNSRHIVFIDWCRL